MKFGEEEEEADGELSKERNLRGRGSRYICLLRKRNLPRRKGKTEAREI